MPIEKADIDLGNVAPNDFSNKRFSVDTESSDISLNARCSPFINTFGRGATGNGTTDDTAACQRAIDRALQTGYRWEPEPGAIFRTTAPLVIDRSAVTSDFDRHKPLIRGGGEGSTVFISDHGGACFDVRGGTGGGAHSPIAMQDLRIEGTNQPDSVGLLLDNAVWANFSRLTIVGMGFGIDGTDVLGSSFDRLKIRGNRRGFRLRRQNFSYPNANTFRDVICSVNTEYGGLIQGGASFNWFGGTIEGNGSDETSWGLKMEDGGVEGAGGLTMTGVYAELNQGVADVWLTHPTRGSAHTINGGGFARGLADHHVQANIRFECSDSIDASLWLGGVGFGKVGVEYADHPSRPYVNMSGALGKSWRVIDAGNRPENPDLWHGREMEQPGGPLAIARFEPSSGSLISVGCRNVSNVLRHGPGDYTVNYQKPLRTSRNSYLASSNDITLPPVAFTEQADLVRVRIHNLAGNLFDPVGELTISVFGNRY